MVREFVFLNSYEAHPKRCDYQELAERLPKEKAERIIDLLSEFSITEDYWAYFFIRFYFLFTKRRKIKQTPEELNFLRFCKNIKGQNITQLFISYKGKNNLGEYKEGKITLTDDKEYIWTIQRLFSYFISKRRLKVEHDELMKLIEKKGPKPKPINSTLRKAIPEMNYLLTCLGNNTQARRDHFLGTFLVIANVLSPTPPHRYKNMTDYFHARIKSYLSPSPRKG